MQFHLRSSEKILHIWPVEIVSRRIGICVVKKSYLFVVDLWRVVISDVTQSCLAIYCLFRCGSISITDLFPRSHTYVLTYFLSSVTPAAWVLIVRSFELVEWHFYIPLHVMRWYGFLQNMNVHIDRKCFFFELDYLQRKSKIHGTENPFCV